VEDLAIKNMVKNPNLAKAITDQGWGMFQTMLKYKAEKFGHTYIEIGRFFRSQGKMRLKALCIHPTDQSLMSFSALIWCK
jgi:hypothetical protein